MQKKYTVLGMRDATPRECETVKNALLSCEEVAFVEIHPSFATVLVTLPDNPTDDQPLFEAVSRAGYTLLPHSSVAVRDGKIMNAKIPFCAFRATISFIFLLLLLFVDAGGRVFTEWFEIFEEQNFRAVLQIFLFLPILFFNFEPFRKGIPALFSGKPNTDALVSAGVGAAAAYSVYNMLRALIFTAFSPTLLFVPAGMILTLAAFKDFTVLKIETEYTSHTVQNLVELMPEHALVCAGGQLRVIPAASLFPGDVAVVRAGDTVPADGKILCGSSLADESLLLGTKTPRKLFPGAKVYAGTVNLTDEFRFVAEKTGEYTLLSEICSSFEEICGKEDSVREISKKFGKYFACAALSVTFFVCAFWLFFCRDPGTVLRIGVFMLTVSAIFSPETAVFLAAAAGMRRGIKEGVLFHRAAALEDLRRIDTVIFDRRGDDEKESVKEKADESGKPIESDKTVKFNGEGIKGANEPEKTQCEENQSREERARTALKNSGVDFVFFSDGSAETSKCGLGTDGGVCAASPAEKGRRIREVRQSGKRVSVVGESLGDIPGFAASNVSVALFGSEKILRESADVLLKTGTAEELYRAFRLSKRTAAVMRKNLWISALFSLFGMILSAAGYTDGRVPLLAALLSFVFLLANAAGLRLIPETDL